MLWQKREPRTVPLLLSGMCPVDVSYSVLADALGVSNIRCS